MEDEWTKVDRNRGEGGKSLRRKRPAVSRNEKNPSSAYLTMPSDMARGARVTIYKAGNKIGFSFGDEGDFLVREPDKSSAVRRITIPSALAEMLPIGLHDVDLVEGPNGMLVLDCSAIQTAAI